MEMLATFHFHEILPQEDGGTDLLGLGSTWSFTHLWGAYSNWNIEFKIFSHFWGGGNKEQSLLKSVGLFQVKFNFSVEKHFFRVVSSLLQKYIDLWSKL